mmetsp:Transcript_9033/g.8028  ORF Transcript_9033/g.8028 Transcript_9033/m.8028 type:complete len:99 (+) Transcript_9033:99-395(+)
MVKCRTAWDKKKTTTKDLDKYLKIESQDDAVTFKDVRLETNVSSTKFLATSFKIDKEVLKSKRNLTRQKVRRRNDIFIKESRKTVIPKERNSDKQLLN